MGALGSRWHVVANTGGRWAVRRHGASRTYRSYLDKQEAVRAGLALAQRDAVRLVVHRRDGTVDFTLTGRL